MSALHDYITATISHSQDVIHALREDFEDAELQAKCDAVERKGGRYPAGRTTLLAEEWLRSEKVAQLYRDAVAQMGLDPIAFPLLEAVHAAHRALLDAAIEDYENHVDTRTGKGEAKRLFAGRHSEAVIALTNALPAVEARIQREASASEAADRMAQLAEAVGKLTAPKPKTTAEADSVAKKLSGISGQKMRLFLLDLWGDGACPQRKIKEVMKLVKSKSRDNLDALKKRASIKLCDLDLAYEITYTGEWVQLRQIG